MATIPLLYLNQYFSTQLSTAGGIDSSQTTGITLQSISGVDYTKPGLICVTFASPLVTANAEFITYTSINNITNELNGVTRGAEGYAAKAHSEQATVAFVVSEGHVNRLNEMFDTVGLDIAEIATPASPDAGRNKLYFKNDDNLYKLTSAGVETVIGGGSGGGGASGTILNWSNVTLPDSNFASISKTVGTNWVGKTIDFDASTDEACYWEVLVPSDLSSITTAKLHFAWTATAGTATQACYWQVTTRSLANDEVIDATTTPSVTTDTGNDALLATGDLHTFTINLTTTGWAAGDLIQIKLNRDADNGSDNLTGDAKVLQCFLELR